MVDHAGQIARAEAVVDINYKFYFHISFILKSSFSTSFLSIGGPFLARNPVNTGVSFFSQS